MKKICLMGRSESGKTTLHQALNGNVIMYEKTQYVKNFKVVIDTPGEWTERAGLAKALSLYTYEADVVGILVSATETFSRFPPGAASICNRPVIGIITKIDSPDADVERATRWLELAGVFEIYQVSSYTGDGVWRLLEYLREPGDVLPWDNEIDASSPRLVVSDKDGKVGKVGDDARRISWKEVRAINAARKDPDSEPPADIS